MTSIPPVRARVTLFGCAVKVRGPGQGSYRINYILKMSLGKDGFGANEECNFMTLGSASQEVLMIGSTNGASCLVESPSPPETKGWNNTPVNHRCTAGSRSAQEKTKSLIT